MKSRLASWTVVAILASSTAARPQMPPGPTALAAPASFGLGDQILHIPAAAFQSQGNALSYEFGADGYLRCLEDESVCYLVAPLTLPAGSQIWAMCSYFYNTASLWNAATSLQAVKQAHGTTAPEVVDIRHFVMADTGGYEFACSNFTYTYRHVGDADKDGTSEELAHQIEVAISEGLRLGGVRVFWRHQISPQPAVASFSDVPPGDPAFRFVEAARSAGVTAGCAGGRYCPDGPWTRRQMAMFLAKAMGLYWR